MNQHIGDIIKELRLANNLTQEELGKLLGVSKSAVQKYEKGIVTNLKIDTARKICSIFKVMPNAFFRSNTISLPKILQGNNKYNISLRDHSNFYFFLSKLNFHGLQKITEYIEDMNQINTYKNMEGSPTAQKIDIGKIIKIMRLEKGWSQEYLANLLGIKKTSVQKYENGSIVNYKYKTICTLCQIFDLPIWIFLHEIRPNMRSSDYQVLYTSNVKTDLPLFHSLAKNVQLSDTLNQTGYEKVIQYAKDLTKIKIYQKEEQIKT